MTVIITVSAQFANSNGTPATGLALADVNVTLVSIAKSGGAEVTIWSALDATREVTGLGMYQKDYALANLEDFWYFAMAQYVGASVLGNDFTFGAIGEVGLDDSGRVDIGDWLGSPVTLSSGNLPDVNIGEISDDAGAADNLESDYDGIGYAKPLSTMPALVTEILTTQMTEAYAADGVDPTLAQALFLIQQSIGDFSISGTTLVVKKVGGSTAATYTLDDASNPSSRTRAT